MRTQTSKFLEKRDQYKKGFTLVEVLVVISITTFLSGMVLTYSSKGRSQVALYVESAKLAQVVLRAKSLALATYGSPNPPCAYGMRVNYLKRAYSLFSYNPTNCSDIPNEGIDIAPEDQFYHEIESFALPTDVTLQDAPKGDTLEYVMFVPPDPTTYIWLKDAGGVKPLTDTIARAVLGSAQSPGNTSAIKVSPAGQISF